MDLLRTAVVDITTLAATCRALDGGLLEGELDERLRSGKCHKRFFDRKN